jgi:hypothetical protein
MNQIEFVFALIEKWPEKLSNTHVVQKLFTDYLHYCHFKDVQPEYKHNLTSFIEKRKYEEKPVATRHDIYRAAQVQLLDEMLFLKNDDDFVQELFDTLRVGFLNKSIGDTQTAQLSLDIIKGYLDRYDEDETIDAKLINQDVKWDSLVG